MTIKCIRFKACGNECECSRMEIMEIIQDGSFFGAFVCPDCYKYFQDIKIAFLNGEYIEIHK